MLSTLYVIVIVIICNMLSGENSSNECIFDLLCQELSITFMIFVFFMILELFSLFLLSNNFKIILYKSMITILSCFNCMHYCKNVS